MKDRIIEVKEMRQILSKCSNLFTTSNNGFSSKSNTPNLSNNNNITSSSNNTLILHNSNINASSSNINNIYGSNISNITGLTSHYSWIKLDPSKVNIHGWKAFLERLPTRDQLMFRQILVSSSVCILCNSYKENTLHMTLLCGVADMVWNEITTWCKLPPFFAFDIKDVFSIHKNVKKRRSKSSLKRLFGLHVGVYEKIGMKFTSEIRLRRLQMSSRMLKVGPIFGVVDVNSLV